MKKTVISVMTRDQFLIKLTTPVITAGNNNNDYISLKLDRSWIFNDGTNLKMTFFVNGTDVIEVPVVGTMCQIPSELLQNECTLIFGLIAVKSDAVVKTSNPASYKILPGAKTTGRPVVNWEGFKADLIELLADVYDNALTVDASFDDILLVISDGFNELIQKFNEKFNTSLTTDANIANIIFALNNVISPKTIVQTINYFLRLSINTDNISVPEIEHTLYNFRRTYEDYHGFFEFTIDVLNKYQAENEKYDVDTITMAQATTAIWGITYYIQDIEYWRDLYKEWWQNAVNASKREEEEKIDFNGFTFDSAEELEIQLGEISTETEETVRQLHQELDFYKNSYNTVVQSMYNFYVQNGGNNESGGGE